jgi:hypothetical protein
MGLGFETSKNKYLQHQLPSYFEKIVGKCKLKILAMVTNSI